MWKRSVIKILALITIIMAFVGVFNWVVDPMMQFRYNNKIRYNKIRYVFGLAVGERYINAGIIKNMTYDAAIVGTSMTENFLIKDANKILGINAIKIPLSGGTAKEFSILLDYLFAQQKAKVVMYGLDIFSYRDMSKSNGFRPDWEFPLHMYSDKLEDKLKYLVSLSTARTSIQVLENTVKGKGDDTLDKAFCWYQDYRFGKSYVLADWHKRNIKLKEVFDQNEYQFSRLKYNFDNLLLNRIQQNQKVKFIIFFPPYSFLTWKLAEERGSGDNLMMFKEYALRKLIEQKNVEVYDFQGEDFIYNLDNYRDISHYSEKINHLILQRIANKTNLITSQNIESHLAKLRTERAKWRAAHPEDVAEIEALKFQASLK